MNKVSVIIPVYNSENSIRKTVESVLAQTYKNIEVIIIDDGSVDSSREKCRSLALDDPRIVLKEQDNRGVSAARNAGLEVATGEWVYFLDSDDIVEPNFLEMLSKYFLANVDVIQFGTKRVLGDELIEYRATFTGGEVKFVDGFADFISVSGIGALCVWLHLIRRNLIANNKIRFCHDMRHNEDMLFMYSVLARIGEAVFVGRILHTQFLIPGSLSRSPMNALKVRNRLMLVDRVLQLSMEHGYCRGELVGEANQLLKGYFGSLLALKDESPCIDIQKNFIKDYREFYLRWHGMFSGLYPKVGALSLSLVIYALKVRFALRGCACK